MISKTVFVGTPEFSVPSLQALINTKFKPLLVICQPDRPKGRKLQLLAPPVKVKALEYQIPVLQPENINCDEVLNRLEELNPDIIISISYGGYIGLKIRKLPKYGVINIHPSLLPLYRGATPLQNTLLNGDNETAVTIFKLVSKMDAGPLLYQNRYSIPSEFNYTVLHDFLAEACGNDLLKFLDFVDKCNSLVDYTAIMIPQRTDNVIDTEKVSHETRLINWNTKSLDLVNHIRAFSENPGAYTYFRGKQLKILKAHIVESEEILTPGTITAIEKNKGFYVSTLDSNILIELVQVEGKRIMTAHEYNIGARLVIGEHFTDGL